MKNKRPVKFPSLDHLANLSVAELQSLYEELLQRLPPIRASREFLRGNIAWSLQATHQGKSPLALRQAFIKRSNGRSSRTTRTNQAGTRLIREWQGKTHEVTILEKGYQWQGKPYRSLSRIAEEITGTRWSGPRFFGLKAASGE
jgi:hypothetical protein